MNASTHSDPTRCRLSRRSVIQAGFGITAFGTLALAACSREPDGNGGGTSDLADVSHGAMPDWQAGMQFTATEDLTFDMLFPEWPEEPYRRDWQVWEELASLTRVSLNATVTPLSDYGQRRSLLISAGDAPHLIPLTYVGEESPFTASGALLPVSEYVEHMPNFRTRVEEWNLHEDIDRMRQVDGRFYLFPGLFENPNPDFTVQARMDILEEEGIPVPDTWDEFRSVLEQLKDRAPGGYPFSDQWQGNSTLNVAAVTFGTRFGWGAGDGTLFDHDAGEFIYAARRPQHREFIDFWRGLVADGLMDPESFTQDNEIAQRKFVTGDSLFIGGNAETVAVWPSQMAGTLGEGNFRIAKIPVPAGPAGPLMNGNRLWHGFVLPATVRDHPNFLAMLQFIDWAFYDLDAKEFLKWGIEGETFRKESDGTRVLADDITYQGLNPAGTLDLERDLGFNLNIFADGLSTDLVHSMMTPEEAEFQEAMLATRQIAPINPGAPLTDAEREQATLLTTPLNDLVSSSNLEFILGRRPMSEWDGFVEQLDGQGVGQYLDLVNRAYERAQEQTG